MKFRKLVAILFLAGMVSAWHPYTHKHLAQEAVTGVWGPGTYGRCIRNRSVWLHQDYCRWFPKEYQVKCLYQYELPQPSYLPILMFNDTEKHANYGECPIRAPPYKKELMCGDGINYAFREGDKWIGKADEAQTECEQVFLFAVASNYYAAAFNPLNQVEGETSRCSETLMKGVDAKLKAGEDDWAVQVPCRFEYLIPGAGASRPGSHSQKFTVSPVTMQRIIENLTEKASRIKDVGLPATELVEGVFKRCEYYAGKEVCGICYCLETDYGCENINLGIIGEDLEYAVNKKVEVETIKDYVSSEVCPQTLKIFRLQVTQIPTTSSVTTTSVTTTTDFTTTTIPQLKPKKSMLPYVLLLALMVGGALVVVVFVKLWKMGLFRKSSLEKAGPRNPKARKPEGVKRLGGADGRLPERAHGSRLDGD